MDAQKLVTLFHNLHANSAASSLTRLMDMEVPSYKLNASLRGVLAQRLLRNAQNAALKDPSMRLRVDSPDFLLEFPYALPLL